MDSAVMDGGGEGAVQRFHGLRVTVIRSVYNFLGELNQHEVLKWES